MEAKKVKTSSKEKEKNAKKNITLILVLAFTFFGAFLIHFILQVALNTQSPLVVVISDSMEPNLYKGDLLFLRGYDDPAEIKNGTVEDQNGDIIVFDASGLYDDAPDIPVVHRVVGKWYNETLDTWFFYTKGDANSNMDGAPHPWSDGVPIPASRIIGVVIGKIPFIGWIKILLADSGLLVPLLVILSVLLIISIIWDFKKEKDTQKFGRGEFKEIL